jgi:FAD/FMN-containing dehydrogenase
LTRLERGLGGTLSAFELMWPEFLHTMTGTPDTPHRLPLAPGAAGYILVEAEGGAPDADHARFEAVLAGLLEDGCITDAAIAQSEAERRAFWAIRNDIPRLGRHWYPGWSFDVSVPIAQMADYVAELRAALLERWPAMRLLAFGHVADNNLHIVVAGGDAPRELGDAVADCVYRGVLSRRGSISAEHGIGLDKRQALQTHRPAGVLALMRQLKASLDPQGLLNPGKVV